MKLNVAICDDSPIICDEVKRRLLNIRPGYLVDVYSSGAELLESNEKYDLIFLDIEMPEIDGMTVAESLRERKGYEYIVFLTSHIEYMPDAFKVKAFRFLNKPIEDELFFESVSEAERELFNNEKIVVTIKGASRLINIKDIVFFEAFGDGTYIFTKDGVLETNKPLKYWFEKVGDEHFYQVHKSYLIALRYVKSTVSTVVEMHYTDEKIPVSRRKQVQFKNAFIDYVKKNAKYM